MEHIIVIIAFIAIVAVFIFYNKKMEKQRSEQLAFLAKRLGFEFHALPPDDLYHHYRHFQLFTLGSSRKIKNLFNNGSAYNLSQLFGYQYSIRSGRSSTTIRQTVASFQNHENIFPDFDLRPEHLFHKIGQHFGYQDIDFDDNKDFSDSFLLRGKDEASIRKLFDSRILRHLQSKTNMCIEARGNTVVFYQQGKRVAPQEVEAFYQECQEIYNLLCHELK